MNGTLLDGEVGFKKIHFNGTRGTAVKFNNAMNISTEMKWKDCFDFRSDSILFTAEQREIRSFNRLFKNRTNVENIHGLCNALKQCVDGDPCQEGWLTSECDSRLATSHEHSIKKINDKKKTMIKLKKN